MPNMSSMDDATRLASDVSPTPARPVARPSSRDRDSKDSRPSSTGWLSSSGGIDHGRFEPGTVLGGALPHRWTPRPRRHGRGLSGRRPEARPAGRTQVSAARRRHGPGTTDTAPHRGPAGAAGVAPQRLSRLRYRRDRRLDVPVDGIRRRRRPFVTAAPRRPLFGRARARDRAADLRRPRRRPRARRDPSRSQTGQRHARRRGQGPNHRLRPRRRVGRSDSRRHARLHGARAARGSARSLRAATSIRSACSSTSSSPASARSKAKTSRS